MSSQESREDAGARRAALVAELHKVAEFVAREGFPLWAATVRDAAQQADADAATIADKDVEIAALRDNNVGVKVLFDERAATIAQLRKALGDLRNYFAYGQQEHAGMSVVATPRCAPSAWKEIRRRVDAALAPATPGEEPRR